MQNGQDQWYQEVDLEEYEPGGRYALSIQVRKPPTIMGEEGEAHEGNPPGNVTVVYHSKAHKPVHR